MEGILTADNLVALLTLTVLEIVLGIDNIIFISILAARLPAEQQARARTVGLGLAMFMRIALLLSLAWIVRLTAPLFTVLSQEISGRDLILIGGGLFLLGKSTWEIHHRLEGEPEHTSLSYTETGRRPAGGAGMPGGGATARSARQRTGFASTIVQIMLLDLVFSLDSVITAVGMANELWVMVTAVIIAVAVMMILAGPVSGFIEQHPTVKMLALSFLLLIGVALIAEGFDQHIPKGYIYFAMGFSVFVEFLNIRARRRGHAVEPLHLRQPYMEEDEHAALPRQAREASEEASTLMGE
jgi:predicted tellurium resistance membrane protein TerC